MSDSPVSIIYDSNGDPIHVVEVNGEQHLGSAIVQDVRYSTANSSTSNLNSDSSFTGTSEALFGLTSIEVFCFSDKVILVEVQQSLDQSNWDVLDDWLVYPNSGDGRTVGVTGKFFRVVARNISPENTTSFRLNTSLFPVADLMPRTLTKSGTIRMSQRTKSMYPSPVNFTEQNFFPPLYSDKEGNLNTRGPVITDEGSFRDDFTLDNIDQDLTGTVTFSDSLYVTGTSTSFLSEVKIGTYIKLKTDTLFTLGIVKDVVSDTLLILEVPYLGTQGSGTATISNWGNISGIDGYINHSTSNVELLSGEGAGSYSVILKEGDYLPYSLFSVAKLSGRAALQESWIGFMESQPFLSKKMAAIIFDGTDNTKVKFKTSFDSSDQEVTEVTIPNGGTTADYHEYRIDAAISGISIWIDGVKLAFHYKHIPGPYDYMGYTCGIMNFGPTDSNTLTVDLICFNNHNRLSVSLAPVGDTLPVQEYRPLDSESTSVSAATGDTQLLASSMVRTGATVYNESSSVLYLKLGTGASSSSFTVIVPKNSYYELPYGYRGAVHGAWASATGDARITEVF